MEEHEDKDKDAKGVKERRRNRGGVLEVDVEDRKLRLAPAVI